MVDVRRNISAGPVAENKKNKKFLIIRAKAGKIRGLLSLFIQIINNLQYCDENNMIPIIDITGSEYWLFDSSVGNNVWEYYFYPVSSSKISPEESEYASFILPVSVSDKPLSEIENQWDDHFLDNREYYNRTILKHLRIKEHIIESVDIFYNNNMKHNKNTLGVQIRGTDTAAISVPINTYIQEIHSYLKEHQVTKIYVASDTYEALEKVKECFPELVIFYDCIRQTNFNGGKLHGESWKRPGFKSPKDVGEEALIETLLLSKCDYIIHTKSSVAIAALLFNPQIGHTFLRRPTK